MAAITRLGPAGYGVRRAGSFAGKTPEVSFALGSVSLGLQGALGLSGTINIADSSGEFVLDEGLLLGLQGALGFSGAIQFVVPPSSAFALGNVSLGLQGALGIDGDIAIATAASDATPFNLRVAEFVDEAFERCLVDPSTLTVRHLRSARRSLSLLMAQWDNKGVKLWTVDQVTLPMVDGIATYNTADGTVCVLDAVLRRAGVDTIVFPMTRSEYAAIPNKSASGFPTRFYLDRARVLPTITLWQVPENGTDTLVYWRMRRLHSVGDPSSTLDIPSRWFEPLVSGLAAKLAIKFRPERARELKLLADEAFMEARQEERERADTQFTWN